VRGERLLERVGPRSPAERAAREDGSDDLELLVTDGGPEDVDAVLGAAHGRRLAQRRRTS
jgi:hypothetical protein